MANPGTGYTVEAAKPGKQAAGGIGGWFGQKTDKAQGPNAAAYNVERTKASNKAAAYGDQALGYTQSAPTIANQYQDQSRSAIGTNVGVQRALADQLRANNGEASQAQFQSNLDQGIAAQMAAANSTTGGAVARAGAARNAASQASLMRAQGASESARLGALEREAALGQAVNVYGNIGNQLQGQYGLEQQSAIAQGQLDSINQAQQNQMRLGYGALGNQAQGQSLDALNSYTSGNLAAQGLSYNMQRGNAQDTNQMVGMAAGVAGTAIAGPVGGAAAGKAVGGKAAAGGAIGHAPNSIAQLYAPARAEARQHTASLAEALAGIEALKAGLRY